MHLSIVTGLLLPAYQTFKALKASKTDAFEAMLTKWVVIAIFASMCYLADIFVSWLPFYQDFKILCLLVLTVLREEVHVITFECAGCCHFVSSHHPTLADEE
jgi:TB2/DP1/HVA22 family protein